MPAAFGPVLTATSWIPGMLACAEKTPSDFAREVPEGTRYVAKSAHRGRCPLPPQPTTSVQGARWLSGNTVLQQAAFWIHQSSHAQSWMTHCPMDFGAGLITNCADCMGRDPLARLWRVAGARNPETGYRVPSCLSRAQHRTALGLQLAARHGDTAISPPWG